MQHLFSVGDTVYGFCDGFFGSSDYETKKCVYVTPIYAVFEYVEGEFEGGGVILGYEPKMVNLVDKWKFPTNSII